MTVLFANAANFGWLQNEFETKRNKVKVKIIIYIFFFFFFFFFLVNKRNRK